MTFTTCRRALACGLTAALLAATPGLRGADRPRQSPHGGPATSSPTSRTMNPSQVSALLPPPQTQWLPWSRRCCPGPIQDALDYLEANVGDATLGQKASLALGPLQAVGTHACLRWQRSSTRSKSRKRLRASISTRFPTTPNRTRTLWRCSPYMRQVRTFLAATRPSGSRGRGVPGRWLAVRRPR